MKTPSLINRASYAFQRFTASIAKRRQAHLVEDLPDYLLKDIGWPASQSDCCTDRAR